MSRTRADSQCNHGPPGRIVWLDVLRGLAVVAMIAGHAADAYLAPRSRVTAGFGAFNVAMGFVAPIFLLVSGVSLWLSLVRRNDPARRSTAHGSATLSLLAPLRSLLAILLLAYWLQIPVLSLRQLVWNQRPDELARLFDINILQAIALPALCVLGVVALARRASASRPIDVARAVAAALALALIAAAPLLAATIDPADVPVVFRSLVAPQPFATFPPAPFSAYLLIGFVVAPWLVRERPRAWSTIALTGTVFVLIGLAWGSTTPMTFEAFWRDSVPHTMMRLGGVLVVCGATILLARGPARAHAGIAWLGRHALAVYVLHLVLIYGSPLTMGSRYWFDGVLNRALSPLEVLLAASLVLALVVVAVRAWTRLRAARPRLARLTALAWWGGFLALFLLRP